MHPAPDFALDAAPHPPGTARVPAAEVFANPRVWLSFAALVAMQVACTVVANYRVEMLWVAVRAGVMDGLSWVVVLAVGGAAAWFLPLEDGRVVRSVLLLLGGAVGVIWLRLELLHPWLGYPVGMGLLHLFPTQLVFVLSQAGAGYAILYYFRSRDSELAATRLEAALARANLQLLEMQVDPHFLFNTLNSVAALMQRDPAAAMDLLGALKRLLARGEGGAAQQTVALRDELELVRVYLAIEQRRLGARLRVVWRVDPEAGRASVPRLVLQTLAENAVRHGVARVRGGGTVEIGARRQGARLLAWVRDDGAGMRAAPRGRGGIGLSNTAARLGHLYGADHRFQVHDREEGGVQAWIDIPFVAADAGGEARDG